MSLNRVTYWSIGICLLLLLTLTSTTTRVTASHFAYGTISWQLAATPALPNHYLVNFEAAYRRDYPTFTPYNPSAGQTFTASDLGTLTVSQTVNSGPCCGQPYYSSCWSQHTALPGSGCGIWSKGLSLAILVLVTYPDDWLSGQTQGISYDAPDQAQIYSIVYSMCCRIGTLVYSGGSSTQVTSAVGISHQYSPRSTSFPRQYVVVNTPISWSVPSIHPLGWPMTYGIATTTESQLTAAYPVGYGTTFSLNSATGVASWTPNTLGLFAIQFKIYSQNPANAGQGTSFVVLDTIFSVITACTISTPNCFHAPVFDPAVPATYTFYQGSAGSMTVTARSDDNAVVQILTSPLPPGAAFTYVSAVSGKNSAGNVASWTTYVLTWTPALTSVPATVCFTARATISGAQSVGSNCANLIFGTGGILYLSGILRDFHKSTSYPTYLTDFNHGDGDIGASFVSSTLSANNLPTFSGSSSTTSAANFPNWYVTDPNKSINLPQVYDMILNNATTNKGNVYSWNPGSTWWPLDNQLFGNEGDSNNRYFTLEIHSYITYLGGEILLFESSDDLWVFIDKQLPPNWNMAGILSSQRRSFSVYMDQIKSVTTDINKTFQIDIFYAHRSSSGAPGIKISMMSATLCNSLDAGNTLINLGDFSGGANVISLVGSAAFSSNQLRLISNGASLASAAWFTDLASTTPKAYKISHGFSATFSFRWDGVTEGFAFVLQFDNGAAQGGQGGQLGYGGLAGIKNSIAIEFDGVSTSTLGDPTWQHIGIHSRWTDANDANELSRVSGSVYSPVGTVLNFNNGTTYDMRIDYTPAIDNGQSGPQYGWIRVYVLNGGAKQAFVPVTSAQVDGVVLQSMWHGNAYVGFTSSTSDTAAANIYITKFALTVVPPSAPKSIASSLPTTIAAGQTGTMVVKLKDVCGNVLTTGGDCAALSVTVVRSGAIIQTLTCGSGIADNGDGSYTLSYNPTVTSDQTTPYQINVLYSGIPIASSPFSFQVLPGQTDPTKSTYSLAYNYVAANGNPAAGALGSGSVGTVTIVARDTYGNLQTANTDPFLISFNPDISTGGGQLTQATKTGVSTYTGSFATPQATTFQMYVRLQSTNLPNSPVSVTFVAGAADAVQSSASGTGLTSSTAGVTGTFTINLRDSAGNAILQNNPSDATCLTVANGCILKPVSTVPTGYTSGIQTNLPAVVNVPVTCAWGSNSFLTCTYQVTVAYTYNVVMYLNGRAMTSLSNTQIVIGPSSVYPSKCIASKPASATAGVSANLLIQLRDQYSNNYQLPYSTSFVVTFDQSLATTPGSPVYTGSYGLYTLAFVPTFAGTYNIFVSLSGTQVSLSPYALTVAAGTPDQKSIISVPVVTTITAASTQTSTFKIESHDAYNNIRVQGGPGTDYLVTLTNTVTTQVLDTIATIADTTTQLYTVNWGTSIAGSYMLHAKVRSQSSDISGGAVAVTVNPAAVSTAHCVASGPGTLGGVIGQPVTITVVAKDQFDNTQLVSPLGSEAFRAIVTSGNTSSPATFALTRSATTGLYTTTYFVPYGLAGDNYQVQVQRLEGASSYVDLPGSPFTAAAQSSAGSVYVTLENAATAQINTVNTFKIVERDAANGGGLKTDGLFFQVDITSVDGGSSPTITVPGVGVSTGTTTTSNFTVTFNPQFTFPNNNPNFLITVSRNGYSSSACSGCHPVITASPYPITLVAGPVYGPAAVITNLPATVVAGASGSFTVTLKDLFNNPVNYQLSGPVTAVLSPVTVRSPVIPSVTITGVASGTNPVIYTFTYAVSIAAVYRVDISYLTQAIGSAAIISQITVNPAAPSALHSLIQPSSAVPLPASGWINDGTTAGTTDKFTVLVRDQFLNSIDPTLLPSAIDTYLSFGLADGGTGGDAVQFSSPVSYTGSSGAFDVSFVSYVSNPTATAAWPLTVSVSNVSIPIAAKVHVLSAAISATSSVSNLPTSVTAGTAATFTLTATDIYNNPWTSGKISVVARDSLGTASQGSAVTTATPGQYTISLAGDLTTRAGAYDFEIRANGFLFLATNPTITVVAGAVDASKTDVPAFVNAAAAGSTTTVSLGFRDSYNNLIQSLDQATLDTLAVNFPIDTGENRCDPASSDDIFYGAGFTVLPAVSVGGSTNISFIGTKVGNYQVNVSIAGTALDCTRLARMAFSVRPGAGAAANSIVTGLTNVTAGQPVALTITLFDQFGNQVATGGSNVSVGSPFLDATPWSPAIGTDPAYWLHPDTPIVDYNNGVYSVTVHPTLAAVLQAVVTLDGYLIKTYGPVVNGTQNLIQPLVYVSANVPATYSISSLPDNIYAATPFSIQLQVEDGYGNPINVLNKQYSYTYVIVGQTKNPTDYSFTGSLQFLSNGQYQWSATAALSGPATLYISLQQGINTDCAGKNAATPYKCSDFTCQASSDACPDASKGKGSTSITILPATCGAVNSTTPYRCPPADGSICVSDYSTCPSLASTLCAAATPVRCATDPETCVASAEDCNCSNGQKRCPSGACVDDLSTECHTISPCPTGQVACTSEFGATGQCRTDLTQCPSPRVCSPGYVACPDGNSCARSLTNCSTLASPATCPIGTFRCPNGRCTGRVEDCATPKTCPTGQVVCLSDGSCADSYLHCPDQYQCYAPTPFQCVDGSCRTTADGCPSQTTCPLGWVLCENGACSQSLASCLPATECPLNQVRCPTGTCVANRMLCPSQPTCPQLATGPQPVLCSDRSCQQAVAYCVNPRVCPTGSTVCPDGSCVTGLATCPTTTTCPSSTPTLCADGVTCTADPSTCITPSVCPISNPMRCPDGSCRGSLIDCPSRSSCPTDRPVRCADGSCVYSNQQCVNIPSCPTDIPIRCPGGECVAATSLCPTHVTCPTGSSRCADGSCRTDCTGILPISCAAGQLSCPLASVGSLCVNTLDQCPLSFICPAATPVRCLDTSCAATVSACPPLPAALPETSKQPCPDGSWSTDLTSCNTPTSCPSSMPYKCWDETCRASPSDCTTPLACTNPATPFRCPNGACAASPYASDCRVIIESVTCTQSQPVKCPSTYNCVSDVEQCTAALPAGRQPDLTNSDTWASACPPQWARCRDGSCRMSNKTCDATTCPPSLPYLCASGVCAANLAGCPDPMTGCYAPYVGCSTTGQCVLNLDTDCPEPPTSCLLQCTDGLCIPEDQISNYNSICASHICSLRCADGSCGLTVQATNVSATTANNLCTQGGTQDSINLPLKNVCPAGLPYKCPNGLCAFSSVSCVTTETFGNCPADRPIQCANAACVRDSSQCAPIYPCADGEMRCGDGSCRVRQASDTGNSCDAWGIANTCPLLTGSTQPRYRCANGLCATGLTADTCIDLTTGCPNGLITKCPNGACISSPRWGGFNNTVDNCAAVVSVQADGCTSPYVKCSYGGQCVLNTQTDCPLPNGCLPTSPFRCTAPGADSGACVNSTVYCTPAPTGCYRCADGSCAANNDATQCAMLNGCPINQPYRCADGTCAQFGASALLHGATLSQVCQPTVTCAASQVLCYDGSCVATQSLCPSSVACERVLCANRQCVDTADQCPTGVAGNSTSGSTATGSAALAGCPAAVPVLCDNGQCVSGVSVCPTSGSPGSGTGTGQGSVIIQLNGAAAASSASTPHTVNSGIAVLPTSSSMCTGSTPVECFDGTCVATYDVCQQRSAALRGSSSCPDAQVMCPTGECIPDPKRNQDGIKNCRVIPSCGSGSIRCPDGTCVANGVTCPTVAACAPVKFTGYKSVASQRCQDGVCRYVCPLYDGCPHTVAPYQCSNRECALNAESCSSAAIGVSFTFSKVKPFLSPPLVPEAPIRRRLLQSGSAAQSSTGAAAPSGSSSGTDSTGTSGSGWCYDSCASQLKASSYTTLVDINTNQKLVIATDANHVEFESMTISAGSFQVVNTSTATRVSVTISPVSDSIVFAAENRVPSSRTDVATSGYLTYVETVLTPMFQLDVDPNVIVPFSTNITITATMDLTHTPVIYTDICLAKLFTLPEIGYASWRCLYNCKSGTESVRCTVRDDSSTGPASQLTGSIGEPGIYAFVETPVADPVPPSKLSWVQDNALWIFLVASGALVFIFFVFYVAQRLWRYRAKYHEEREEVKKAEAEVEDMQQFGGTAGTKDEEVIMMHNPLVVQMKDMQARLDETQLRLREEEANQKAEATVVRHEHINALQEDRDKLAAELERLRQEIALSTSAPMARPQPVQMVRRAMPTGPTHSSATGGLVSSDHITSDSEDFGTGGLPAEDQPAPQVRTEFQAVRPKKKGKDL